MNETVNLIRRHDSTPRDIRVSVLTRADNKLTREGADLKIPPSKRKHLAHLLGVLY